MSNKNTSIKVRELATSAMPHESGKHPSEKNRMHNLFDFRVETDFTFQYRMQ
jgi:hypothetical protein